MSISNNEKSKILPFKGIRKTIAERLVKSHMTTPHVTLMREVDVTELKRLRERLLRRSKEVRISYTAILVKACADVLKVHLLMNSRLEGDKIQLLEEVHMGVAVALESGLIVLVIRNADEKTLLDIAFELMNLVSKARKGELTISEVTGSTFTITNLGMFNVDIFTPIINPPESAILGVGRMIEKPLVIDGNIKARSVMTLSLTHDHRIIDGAIAAQFLDKLSQMLENPIDIIDR